MLSGGANLHSLGVKEAVQLHFVYAFYSWQLPLFCGPLSGSSIASGVCVCVCVNA